MLSPLAYWHIRRAVQTVKRGGVIAYPTEAVYGLGCDPLHEKAVLRLLAIKQRPIEKGLILIAAEWQHLKPFVQDLRKEILARVLASWPGPVTWLLPAADQVPTWLRGNHTSIAVRITNHPLAKTLCRYYGKPLVSTSANLSQQPPIVKYKEVQNIFNNTIDYIVPGETGHLTNPTEIRDALTGEIVRPA